MRNPGRAKRPRKKSTRIFLSALLAFLALFFIAVGAVYFYKDDISRKILLNLNANLTGNLSISKVKLDLLVHFPSISLQLDSAEFFENKLDDDQKPIASLGQLSVALDIVDLVTGKINISKVTILDAYVNLKKLPDGDFNLTNAFRSAKKKDSTVSAFSKSVSDEMNEFWEDESFSVNIKYVHFKNIRINYIEVSENLNSSISINHADASLNYKDDLIDIQLNSSIEIVDFKLNEHKNLKNEVIGIQTNLSYQFKTKLLTIASGTFSFNHAKLDTKGTIDLSSKNYLDLAFDGSGHDISLFKLFFTDAAIENIETGDIQLNGKVKGPFISKLPEVTVSFGIKNLKLKIPETEKYIEQANLNGSFNSGNKRNLSLAEIKIDKLEAKLPGGQVSLNLLVKNFVDPKIDLTLEMAADIDGFDRVFKNKFFESLSGKLEINSTINGAYEPDSLKVFKGFSDTDIFLDSISFSIPDIMMVDLLDGNFKFKSDSLHLEHVVFKTGDTDVQIDGWVEHLIYLALGKEETIKADLQLKSRGFDLPQFFAYDPKVGEGFPYKIEDLKLEVNIETTVFELLHSENTPKIKFDIGHLEATVVDFLAPVTITQGVFNLGNKGGGLLLDFSGFQLQLAGSDLKTDVEYYDYLDSSFVSIDLQIENMNPGKVLFAQSKEKAPGFMDGTLDGSLKLVLDLSSDSSNFKMIDLSNADLAYHLGKDTIVTNSLDLRADYVSYESAANPFASLSASCILAVDTIKYNSFHLKNIEMGIDVHKGIYDVDLTKINIYDAEGNGSLILDPFAPRPFYSLSYAVKQFDIQNVTSHFVDKKLVSGKADFEINLSMHGSNLDSALINLNGDINFYGKNLVLYGYDVDRLIAKIKKTQNFDLIDVGAVLLAGPVGLAITKGSEITSVLINRSDVNSDIKECISDWTIENGVLSISDVAFSSEENRLAAKGSISLISDSLDLDVALLNKKGCSIMTQSLRGNINNPKINNLKVAQTLIQPVINLAKEPSKIFCKPFYTGVIAQPEEKGHDDKN